MSSKDPYKLRKDNAKEDSSANPVLSDANMDALATMLEGHKVDLSAEFKAAVSTLYKKLDTINSKVEDHEVRVSSLESNANATSNKIIAFEEDCFKLTSKNTKLNVRITDLDRDSHIQPAYSVLLGAPSEGPWRPSSAFSP